MAAPVRIGTCSWADDALSKHWYPPGTPPKERLPYYAERYSTVEVDSTYYRVPTRQMVQGWDDRTPDGFVMHVKAFGLMTRHPVKLEQVPPDLREGMPVDERGRVDRPPRDARRRLPRVPRRARTLRDAASSAGSSSKCRRTSCGSRPRSTISSGERRLGGDVMLFEPRLVVVCEEIRGELLRWLEERRIAVVVDAPKVDGPTSPRRWSPSRRRFRTFASRPQRRRGTHGVARLRAVRPPRRGGAARMVGCRELAAASSRHRVLQQQQPDRRRGASPADAHSCASCWRKIPTA
jgi:hypothetical protein